MNTLLYLIGKAILFVLSVLPLRMVAMIGRIGGALAWHLDGRHRKVAIQNIQRCFGETMSPNEVRNTARENFKRVGESYASAAKTWNYSFEQARAVCEVDGLENFPDFTRPNSPRNCIVAVGHFANFELPGILAKSVQGLTMATTYRGLRQPGLNRLMQEMRQKSGGYFFERRSESSQLKAALNKGGLLLGLFSDQNAAKGGVTLPFLGFLCRTNAAPALFSLRYDSPLLVAICYRVALGRWKVEVSPEIPRFANGVARSKQAIMADVNAVFEAAIRRDPANWFWVHNRWKGAGQPAAEFMKQQSLEVEEADDQSF